MRRIADENPNRSLWALAAIYGFSSLMNIFQSIALGQAMGIAGIIIIAALLAPFWGYIHFAVWSAFISFTGKWIGGRGSFKEVRAAYAWSSVPVLINLPIWLLMAAFFGQQLFLNFPTPELLSSREVSLLMAIFVIKMVVAVWSLIIYINALAVMQRFSVFRAIFNCILAGLVLAVIFYILWNGLIYFTQH